jgi:hypothetical protein
MTVSSQFQLKPKFWKTKPVVQIILHLIVTKSGCIPAIILDVPFQHISAEILWFVLNSKSEIQIESVINSSGTR